jgi:hypothetical protein
MKTVNVLGTDYKIYFRSINDDDTFEVCDGYTDWTTKEIAVRVENETNVGSLNDMNVFVKKVLRHEIVHAFLFESGLAECSGETEAWAKNETMVDWFAHQGEKIYKAWKEAEAL